ncbi:MAG: DUF4166 domain-containing protein [Rhizobiales bacterium]|nr:DUF4166 domain-containing protein [Hyphomicrobiales bacterium]
MRILILGGYGTFGGRLVDLLLDEARLTLFVAGRNPEAAERFCRARKGEARLVPVMLDRNDCEEQLLTLKPDLAVDASGPFQAYGDNPYSFARAAIAAGSDYIDLADGADFVTGISALDELARQSSRFALSGMSSFPVLTAAVVRKLAQGMDGIESIVAGIAPSPFAGVGLNVIRAIASYAGKPVKLLSGGAWVERAGFFDSRRLTVNVPGEIPLRPIRFALAEVPDLKVLPLDWPSLKTMWMGAGPTPAFLHRLLWIAAGLVKLRMLPSLVPLAPVMNWVINTLRWGEHRGGMIVEIKGQGKVQRSWHLVAEGDGGPFIPSMAAEAIIRGCLNGRRPAPGARSGHRDLELDDYAPLLARHGIKTGVRENSGTALPIYREAMGEAFARLAPPLREFHANTSPFRMTGKARVARGQSVVSKLAGWLFGFPGEGQAIDVEVSIGFTGRTEIWTRTFAGKSFRSRQTLGRGRYEGLIVESFGPLNFALAVVERNGGLGLILRGWDIAGLPLPKWLMPVSRASEHGAEERFNFDVEIGLPIFGRIVAYSGWLVPAAAGKSRV